jgi:hypothetical protein
MVGATVRKQWRDRIPSVVHVDGTARIHSVDREADTRYHALLSEVAAKTGVPVLLNTSFNLPESPIVESPRDALQCFLFTELDVVYMERFRIAQPPPRALTLEKDRRWEYKVSGSGERASRRFTFTPMPASVLKAREITVPQVRAVDMDRLCLGFDGTRTLAEGLEEAGPDALSDPTRVAEILRLVKQGLRAGGLHLRFGSDVL